MTDSEWTHTTVLLQEAVTALLQSEPGCYVDATFGRGGHSNLILSHLHAKGQLIAFDKDPEAVRVAQAIKDPRFSIRHQGFAHISDLPRQSVVGVLMDLGISSPQIDNPVRGFSFRSSGPLDMRMDPSQGESVKDWLHRADELEIKEVIKEYGEERFAASIAKAIVTRRQERGVPQTTTELAQLVAGAVKTRESGQDPATRTFQAFRIFINRELEELHQALEASLEVLQPGGRLVVISFHSLEDRIVKQFIAKHSKEQFDRRAPFARPQEMAFKRLERIKPSMDEVQRNPRSRSAIMRVAQRLGSMSEVHA
jgi:16S rRNA (cytosine1402-N4)-methyltransferase